jgi:hypothetical protein
VAITQFDPPGFLDDLDATQRQKWSDFLSDQLDAARSRDGSEFGLTNDGPRLQFFNPLRNQPDSDALEKDISWTAFPRLVQINSVNDVQRWRKADGSREVQDEYCEWSVSRDPATHKITRVTFTSEGPEYWSFLAASNPQKALEIYQKHISPEVTMQDLFAADGSYNAHNRFNNSTEGGAMHLIQQNNTLGAEIEIAGAATLIRRRNGEILTSEQDLIACGQYGQPQRNSDPHIGSEVNALARAHHDISLANPISLCIASLSAVAFMTPDGSDPASFWTVTRGTRDKALRAVYEVPSGKRFVVGDIKINGRTIDFGAQIADFTTIKLTGLATRLGKSTVQPVNGCAQAIPQPSTLAATSSVASILAASRNRAARR